MKLPAIKCLFVGAVAVAALFGFGCRKRDLPANSNANAPQANPPFVAKEPEQYRAERVSIYTDDAGQLSTPHETAIARDGARRRTDFTTGGGAVSLIETPEGNFLVSNERAVFARVNLQETADAALMNEALEPDLSPDRLLHQDELATEFRQMRRDQFNARAVTVYQAIIGAGGTQTESWIWIDDETGFPLKNEYFQMANGVRSGAGMVTEIRDLTLGPPPTGWFDVPATYREVPVAKFWSDLARVK